MKTRLLLSLLAALAAAPAAAAADRVAAVTLDGGRATIYAGTALGLPTRTIVRGADRAVLSPDARALAYTRLVGATAEIRIRRLPAGSDRLAARVEPADIALAFSPDGTRLAYSSSSGITIVSLAASTRRLVPLPAAWRRSRFPYIAFTPDGGRLVVTRTSGDGRAGTLRSELSTLALQGGRATTLFRSANAYDQSPRPISFDPSGDVVAADGAGDLLIAHTGGGPTRPLAPRAAPGIDFAPLIDPGGRWVAFARWPRSGVSDVWMARLDGSGLRRVTTTPIPARGKPKVGTHPLAWSPDARKLLVFRHDRLAAVDVDSGKLTTLRHTGVRYAISCARWHGGAPAFARRWTRTPRRTVELTPSWTATGR